MDEIKFYLDITGMDFNAVELKQQLALEPTKAHNKGDISDPGKPWPHNYWSYYSKSMELTDFSDQLNCFIKTFEHKMEEIKNFVKIHKLDMELTAEILRMDEVYPAILVESEVIKRLAELDCTFYVDLMGEG